MTPEDLAARHPRLYHVTAAGSADLIVSGGLLSALQLLDRFEADPETRQQATARRIRCITLRHPTYGTATITDNRPLIMASLARCLDGMTPPEWLQLLNERVFFWVSEAGLATLAKSAVNRMRRVDVLVLKTLSVARAAAGRIELCPFNSGSTIRRPPRRGRNTFTPLGRYSHAEWARLRARKTPDTIREVTIIGGLMDVAPHVVDIRHAV